jgi:SulP family sulfate permease
MPRSAPSPHSVARQHHWLASYRAEFFTGDCGAAVVTTLLLLPQSVAYALLAGLPPQVGIYAGILPPLAYALFGSSNTLAVGPMAVTSLMTAAALAPLAGHDTALWLSGAMWLAVIGGGGLFIAGLLRFGFLTQLLSLPVLSGFTTAAALLIAWSQLSPLLGIRLGELDIGASRAVTDSPTWTPAIAAIGLSALLALWLTQRWSAVLLQRIFSISAGAAQLCTRLMPALIVAVATLVTAWGQLDTRASVDVVGVVHAGIPRPSIAALAAIDADVFSALLVPGLMIALVNFVSSVSIAQTLAALRHERIDANAELRGLGAANLAAGLFGGLPVNGGLSRSAVNFAAGARTPLAGVLTALLMLVIAIAGSELFRYMPVSALAATIIVALLGLMDIGTLRQAWRYDRTDALAWLITAAGVLAFGVVQGIVLGVVTSVISLVWRSSHPHIAVLGRLPGTEQFRNVLRYDTEQLPHVLFCRVDENLFFGNIQAIDQRLRDEIERHPAARHLVLSMLSVSQVDLSAVDVLRRLNTDLELRSVKLHLSDLKGPVQDRLQLTPLWKQLNGRVFISAFAAYNALIATADDDYSI